MVATPSAKSATSRPSVRPRRLRSFSTASSLCPLKVAQDETSEVNTRWFSLRVTREGNIFTPAVGFGDFLNLVAFQVVALQNQAVVLFASLENPADIYGGQVDPGWRGQLGESLEEWLPAHGTAVDVERDAVHPGEHHAGVTQLAKSLPAANPSGLRRLLRPIVSQSA